MSIIREKTHSKNFIIINKQVLNDPNLSWEAKGLWAYLMGLPDDWKISANELQKHSKDGREATLSPLRELVDNGYAEKSRETAKNGQYTSGSWKIFKSKKCLPQPGL